MLGIEVCEIRGSCSVYRVGDRIVIDNTKILLDRTDALMHCQPCSITLPCWNVTSVQ